jgi:tRNA pseudouridine38-40 synthase
VADPGPHAPSAPALSLQRAYRLTVAYDGTDFHGWQVQSDVVTVQGTLLEAARRLLAGDVRLVGASRTDAGVHALRQVVSLHGECTLPPASLQAALNAALPRTVRVAAAADAEPGFDARRSALGKRYVYLIDNAPVPSPLRLRWAWHVTAPLDLAAMRQALGALRGRHDFGAFCAAPGREADPVCRVRAVHVLARKSLVAILVSADRFLHHMVRNVVGSAVEVGRGAEAPGWLAEVLRGRDRTRAGPTAPARGLLLLRVLYGPRC